MFEAYFREKLGPLFLRLGLGFVAVYHGFLKISANGGANWLPSAPTSVQLLVSWAEFGAGLAILTGYRCRLAAAVFLVISLGMTFHLHGAAAVRLPLRTLEPLMITTLLALGLTCIGAGELTLAGDAAASSPSSARPSRKRAAA